MSENGEASGWRVQAEQVSAALSDIRRVLETGKGIIVLTDPLNIAAPIGVGSKQYPFETVDGQLSSLVGRTVIAANGIVSAWAMLYAVVSGHSLPFAASLFDKWARENVQRERTAKLARDFFQRLPRELEHVENLLSQAEGLARERDLLVSQPWSLGRMDEPMDDDNWVPTAHGDIVIEREAQFESLLASLHQLHVDIVRTVEVFRLSRDVEKVRVLNRSAVLAAEFKFGRKAARPKSGPRHKEWRQPLMA